MSLNVNLLEHIFHRTQTTRERKTVVLPIFLNSTS